KREFDMKELGEAKKILGMEIIRDRSRKILGMGLLRLCLKGSSDAIGWALQAVIEGLPGLVYGTDRGNHMDITSFVDLDYTKDLDKGRSIIGYGVHGCVVNWNATLQHVVALLTIEAEYMAFTKLIKKGRIHLSQNRVFQERTKHINVRYHFIKEVLEAKTVNVLKVGTEHNVVHALTKMVPGSKDCFYPGP
ncbi:hypothetical protein Tco_0102400, partial [Tanacetum coccineum]